jgi:hypothetical protein
MTYIFGRVIGSLEFCTSKEKVSYGIQENRAGILPHG